MSFLLNEKTPLIKKASRYDTAWASGISYNSISNSASTQFTESAMLTLTEREFDKIATAKSLAVKIEGSRRSVIYESDEISSEFKSNLKAFFDNYVAY